MTLSTKVHLDRSFINLASDTSQFVACGTAGSIGGGGTRAEVVTYEGEFRQYANGNTRLIQGTGKTRQVTPLVLRALSPAQVAQIIAWIGKTVLFRDSYGRRIWCSYLVGTQTDIPLSGTANSTLQTDMAIDLTEITFDETVISANPFLS